ncbi:MAG: hypothetical protein LBC77_05925 [Spirochaetaceae bacterium]|jgi:hypothetical protein|nr:hypothetical protein [Spirochaetaceae bacterium]
MFWKLAFAAGLFVFVLSRPCAETRLELLVDGGIRDKILNEEVVSAAHFDSGASFNLMPRYRPLVNAIESARRELEPGILIESIGLYKKPRPGRPWNIEEKTALFNGMVSISTLEGLRYYSSSRKKSRLFYETSSIIDSTEARGPRPDPVFTPFSLPSELRFFAKQKDLTFGENIYSYQFTVLNDAILFTQSNITTMYYGPIPVLGQGKLRSVAAVIDAGDTLVLYVASMASAISFPGMKNRVSASFSTRAQAILSWFSEKAALVYKKDG